MRLPSTNEIEEIFWEDRIKTLTRTGIVAIMELAAEKSKFNDGLFARLSKNNRYICFSPKVWPLLVREQDAITKALKAEKTILIKLTDESTVATEPFQGKTYVCFKKKNIYINLDESQWELFRKQAIDLLSANDKENIPPEPTICQYLYITEDELTKVFLSKSSLKEYAEERGLPYRITKKKQPAPNKGELIQLVRAYMTEKRLADLITEHCYGCQYDMPGQRDHTCLEEDAGENYKHLIRLTGVFENVSKVATALDLDPKLYEPEEDSKVAVWKKIPEDYNILFKEIL